MKRLIALGLLTLVSIGCSKPGMDTFEQPAATSETQIVLEDTVLVYEDYTGARVYRFNDNEAATVCYVFVAYRKGGISCLPLNETRLRQ